MKLLVFLKICRLRISIVLIVLVCCSPSWGQLSVPLNSLPAHTELEICPKLLTKCTKYASTYTDTVDKCRLWLFYDTAKSTVNSLLLEVFDKRDIIEKQYFIATDYLMSESNWEYLDFLRDENYGENLILKGEIKKELRKKFPNFLPELSKLFKNDMRLTVRYSKKSRFKLWGGALQILSLDEKRNIKEWLTIEPSYKDMKLDTIIAYQDAHVFLNTFQLSRTIVKNRLIYMETNATFANYFRRFEYDDKNRLTRIIEGHLLSDSEEIDNVISIVPK